MNFSCLNYITLFIYFKKVNSNIGKIQLVFFEAIANRLKLIRLKRTKRTHSPF
jgi:hypothetical protein